MMVAGAPAQLHFFFFNDTATTEIYTLSLHDALPISVVGVERDELDADVAPERADGVDHLRRDLDRKSTRLNSSHSQISYAVFCLKKKQTTWDKPREVEQRVRTGHGAARLPPPRAGGR